MKTTAPITIFEGPDCSGKTTAAKKYAEMTGALYVHAGPMPGVSGDNLYRAHMESMMPALLGLRAVVLDRFHKSESVYGNYYRGHTRLGFQRTALLDRAALRCGAVLVNCRTDWEVTKSLFNARLHAEMLNSSDQLHEIWRLYGAHGRYTHNLPELDYDFSTEPGGVAHSKILELRTPLHAVESHTAGNMRAQNIVVFSSLQAPVDSLLHSIAVLQNNAATATARAQLHARVGLSAEYSTLWVDAEELAHDESFVFGSDANVYHYGTEAYMILHNLKIESIPL